MFNKSFGRIDFLGKALDGTWLKQQAIANNISNVNTPGYKRETVNFEDVLRQELYSRDAVGVDKTHVNHMDMGSYLDGPKIEVVQNTSNRVDANNVNIDVENAELAKNQIRFEYLISQVRGEISRLKTAMK